MSENQTQFNDRRKLLTVREDAMVVAAEIRAAMMPGQLDRLRGILDELHPADLADAMLYLYPSEEAVLFKFLDVSEAAEVLDEVDAATEANLIGATSADRLADIIEMLPSDEGADVVGAMGCRQAEEVLALTDTETAGEIRELLAYPPRTAGGIMSLDFVDVPVDATQEEALNRFRERKEAEHIFYVYVIARDGSLCGTIDLRTLLSAPAETPVRGLLDDRVVVVPPDCDQEQVANIFARYDLTAVPVVASDPPNRLLGVITSDDIIDVIQEESAEDIARMSGSDAHELENKSPLTVARLRLPWIMATMFIELLAGFVIHFFDRTLTRYILLASFMPIISAISGNTGLQSAAIIIRGLSTGHVQLNHWRHAVSRQMVTTMALGGSCALVLGIIAAIWDRHVVFGAVVALGMFASVNIAGVVGTTVPLISKRAGFDPALTAGPFETAFQDVVGISIFLTLATLMLRWL